MEKTRATNHVGKGTSKHNFREFSELAKGNSDINRALSYQNKFFLNNMWFESEIEVKHYLDKYMSVFDKQRERFKSDKRYYDLSISEKYELLYYEKLFGKTINNQHDRNAKRRQQCLNKNAIDMLSSKKTQPEESILQIGNKDFCPVSEKQLWEIYKEYQNKHNAKFGKHIRVIDASLHVDEGTFHIHERKVFVGVNLHNEAYPGKDSALGLLEIKRPDMNKAKGRYNNRKQTYSAECRKLWIETCQEFGLDIETCPREYADKKGLTTIEYKVNQEQKKLQILREQSDKISSDFVTTKQLNDKLTDDIQKNNLLLLSQQSTIKTNSQMLKQQSQKKLSLKNDIDDMEDQAVELNQRMDDLYNEYSERYNEIDRVDYVVKKLEKEYPDYYFELIAEFESQSYMPKYDNLEI